MDSHTTVSGNRCSAPYPVRRPDPSDYQVVRFSNRGKASFEFYEMFRFLEDSWYYFDGHTPYVFDGFVYRQISEEDVENVMYRLADRALSGFAGERPVLKDSAVRDAVKQYRNTHTVADIPEPPGGAEELAVYDSALGTVAFSNGVLNIETQTLLPFTPYVFITFQLRTYYDPELRHHPVESVYEGILPDEATRRAFYRMAGYTLYSETLRLPAIFMLYGGGGTGKSSLQRAITSLMSPNSYSSLTMLDLADRFAPQAMEGKRANFCGEADDRSAETTRISGGMLKDISEGGREFYVQRKFHQAYPIIPTAKLWFCSNVMPDFGDRTSGLYRRLYIVPCRVEQSWDAQIQDAMTEPEALAWFANACLEEYIAFLADGCRIEVSDDMRAELDQYMVQDNIMDFLLSQFGQIRDKPAISGQLEGLSTTEFYTRYEAYCRTQGARPLKSTRFQERIRNEYNLGLKTKYVRLSDGSGTSRTTYCRKVKESQEA